MCSRLTAPGCTSGGGDVALAWRDGAQDVDLRVYGTEGVGRPAQEREDAVCRESHDTPLAVDHLLPLDPDKPNPVLDACLIHSTSTWVSSAHPCSCQPVGYRPRSPCDGAGGRPARRPAGRTRAHAARHERDRTGSARCQGSTRRTSCGGCTANHQRTNAPGARQIDATDDDEAVASAALAYPHHGGGSADVRRLIAVRRWTLSS
jgi:hypothetical protein